MLASGDDEDMQGSGLWATVGGVGALVAGALVGAPAHMRMRQTAYDYNFGYDKKQSFEIPPLSNKLLHPNPTKNDPTESHTKSGIRKKASSGIAKQNNSKVKSPGTKAKKLKSDLSSKIAGTYNGNGKLYAGKIMEDSYSDIQIIITKVDKNHANLRVIENDEDFFESPISLTVTKLTNGGYKLSNKELNGLTVTISKKGELSFNHSQVLIDDEQFMLTITAKR